MARYSAWQFTHPDFETAPRSGLNISRTGAIKMLTDSASVRQALLILLTTRPGERVMRPAYGCDLHRLVFSPNDATTHGLAMHYVRRAIERWEPRVEILDLDANASREDPARMDVRLLYRVRRTLEQDELTLSVLLTEGGV